jgi:hypothetical protein
VQQQLQRTHSQPSLQQEQAPTNGITRQSRSRVKPPLEEKLHQEREDTANSNGSTDDNPYRRQQHPRVSDGIPKPLKTPID